MKLRQIYIKENDLDMMTPGETGVADNSTQILDKQQEEAAKKQQQMLNPKFNAFQSQIQQLTNNVVQSKNDTNTQNRREQEVEKQLAGMQTMLQDLRGSTMK